MSLPDGEPRDARRDVLDAGRSGVVGLEGNFVLAVLLGAATGVAETAMACLVRRELRSAIRVEVYVRERYVRVCSCSSNQQVGAVLA